MMTAYGSVLFTIYFIKGCIMIFKNNFKAMMLIGVIN